VSQSSSNTTLSADFGIGVSVVLVLFGVFLGVFKRKKFREIFLFYRILKLKISG
jgi:predicted transporter